MISIFLILLYVSSVFSKTSALVNYTEYVDLVPYTSNKYEALLVGRPSQQKEIPVARYFSVKELENLILALEKNTEIVKVWALGQSAVDNTTIYAVQISHNVREKRKIMKPMFKFVANIHGADMVGYALMVSLIQYLVYSDGYNERITRMLDEIDVWIVPTMNPDGLSRSLSSMLYRRQGQKTISKTNGKGVDLDGDFPSKVFDKDWVGQPETTSILQLMMNHPFVLSANIQAGNMVVSYPWDYAPSIKKQGKLTLTDDNEFFVDLAKSYASRKRKMSPKCDKPSRYPQGIVNGKYLRKKRGGMQDANYILTNCFEITLYLSYDYLVPENILPLYWNQNVNSMLKLIENTRQGIYGLVKDDNEQPIQDAVIEVFSKRKEIKVTADGEYWRLLSWGLYDILARAPGYVDQRHTVLVSQAEPYVQHNFTLSHQGVHGTVRDMDDQPIQKAVLEVEDKNKKKIRILKVNDNGEYNVTLLGSDLKITVWAPGYSKETEVVQLPHLNTYIKVDFQLMKSKFSLGNLCAG